MISVYNLKPKFQQALNGTCERMFAAGISPNGVTWIGIAISGISGVAFYLTLTNSIYWSILFAAGMLLRMAANAIDGMMARRHNLQSEGGQVLNELGDIASDILCYWPLLFTPLHWFGVILLVLIPINEFAGVLGEAIKGDRRYDGPMGKSDRALVIALVSIPMGLGYHILGAWAMILILSMLLLSTKSRITNLLNQ